MIVQIVLVIVTAVQLNSQELCPSVCRCYDTKARCTNLFIDVQNVTQHRFDYGLKTLEVTGSSRLELEEDLFQRWNITSLRGLELSENNVTKIWERAFYSLAYLEYLDLSRNSITVLHPQTFQNNFRLRSIYLYGNKITSLHPDLFKNTVQLWRAGLQDNRLIEFLPSTFRNNRMLTHLDMSGNKINSIEPDTFLHNAELEWLDLEGNSITEVQQSTFRNNSRLTELYMSNNKINSIQPDTFIHNTKLKLLELEGNSITDLHPSIFRNNSRLRILNMSRNEISSIEPDTFIHNTELERLDLKGNCITDVQPSTFRNNIQLIDLDISRNKITLINADTFIHNEKLRYLYLQGNNITEISNSSFSGLEQLEELDLSNNSIVEMNPLVFHNILTSKNRQNHQMSKLKRLNLSQNMIRSFNFELYFPSSSNSAISNPTFQLEYLNLSANHLTTPDAASVNWLNHTTAVTDLTRNPWNCDCSVLLEVWRELKHKLALRCASPRELQGKSWDVLEGFCSQVVNTKNGCPSVIKTTLIATGVVLVCSIGGGLILTKVVKSLRKRTKKPEYCDVYAPRASQVSDRLYEEVGSGPTHDTVETYADVVQKPSYISVKS